MRRKLRSQSPKTDAASVDAPPPSQERFGQKVVLSLLGGVTAAVIGVGGAVAVALIDDDDPPPSSGLTDTPTTPSSPPAKPPGEYVSYWTVSDGTLTVTASVESYKAPGAGVSFLMPQGAVSPESWPNQLPDPEGYARQQGGVPAGSSSVLLTVRTSLKDSVVISSVKPVLVETRGVVAGDYAMKVGYGCGGMPQRLVTGDFDVSPATFTYDPGTGDSPMPASRMSLSVSASDPEVINVQALARTKAKAWKVVIHYVDPKTGKGATLEVDENGKPFLVTPVADGTATYNWFRERGSMKLPDADPYSFC